MGSPLFSGDYSVCVVDSGGSSISLIAFATASRAVSMIITTSIVFRSGNINTSFPMWSTYRIYSCNEVGYDIRISFCISCDGIIIIDGHWCSERYMPIVITGIPKEYQIFPVGFTGQVFTGFLFQLSNHCI